MCLRKFSARVIIAVVGALLLAAPYAANAQSRLNCNPLPNPDDDADIENFFDCGCGQIAGAEDHDTDIFGDYIVVDQDLYDACTEWANEKGSHCRLPGKNGQQGKFSLTCLLGIYGNISHRPWINPYSGPPALQRSCMNEERNMTNFADKREAAERAYDRSVVRLEALTLRRQRAIMVPIRKIAFQEGLMTQYAARAGIDIVSELMARWGCDDVPEFCRSHPNETATLARKFADAYAQRQAYARQVGNIETAQMKLLSRHFNNVVRRYYTTMVNAYNRENDAQYILYNCFRESVTNMPEPTENPIPTIACFPSPAVKTDGCIVIPFLGGIYCPSDLWCANGACTPPPNIPVEVLCQDGTGGA